MSLDGRRDLFLARWVHDVNRAWWHEPVMSWSQPAKIGGRARQRFLLRWTRDVDADVAREQPVPKADMNEWGDYQATLQTLLPEEPGWTVMLLGAGSSCTATQALIATATVMATGLSHPLDAVREAGAYVRREAWVMNWETSDMERMLSVLNLAERLWEHRTLRLTTDALGLDLPWPNSNHRRRL